MISTLEARPIIVQPLGLWRRFWDFVFVPIMYWFQGNRQELPQETHFWNNRKLVPSERNWLRQKHFARVQGSSLACERWKVGFFPLFHIPICGGWRNYVVLELELSDINWHVGWIGEDCCGVSRLLLRGPVRVLRGRFDVFFFAVDEFGRQLPLRVTGEGQIGLAPKDHRRIRLL